MRETREDFMTARSSVTIELNLDLESKLARLSEATLQSRTELVSAALSSYVERELQFVDHVREGLADIEEGNLVDHEQAMAELDAIINSMEASRP